MAFQVVIRQRPEGMEAHLVKAEMSGDSLQLKLIKALPDIMTVNGVPLNIAQKRALRGMGTAWELTDLQRAPEIATGAVLVEIRREGHVRKVRIETDGKGRFVDGQGDRVQVAMADPLVKTGWGLTEGI